ncbi:MAG: L-threonylcarbamoyladenylate synthase [Phycisphaerales bacterium]
MQVLAATSINIRLAAAQLERGGLVAFPTETVYGLGGDAFNSDAVDRIYLAKGRPRNNPLIVHVDSIDAARGLVDDAIATAWLDFALRFWPGPLTLIVQHNRALPAATTAALPTIAIRQPAHAVARELLRTFSGPIAAPSANRSGHVSPTSAAHVQHDFQHLSDDGDDDDLIVLDGGPSSLGIESTVLDLSQPDEVPVVLRLGSVTLEQLREVDQRVRVFSPKEQTRSPGSSRAHYAPVTPCLLIERAELTDAICNARGQRVAVIQIGAAIADVDGDAAAVCVITLPTNAEGYAAGLYDALRRADAAGADVILIERPPGVVNDADDGLWAAIIDRLTRATFR